MEVGPLTPAQRRGFWITAAVVAVTRLLALSATPWDWDEALFMSAMRDYDVAEHRPHPPGFPIYIALANVFGVLFASEFEALRAINLIAAVLAFPLLFALARALRMDFTTSWLAALLFVFFPNVWFFGGSAFSDVPSVVVAVGAAALLLRGRTDRRAFLAGCAVAAIGIGMRPQNALMAAYPVLAATWSAFRARRYRDIAAGALTGIVILAAAFGGAVRATGSWERYRGATMAHREYIANVDSYLSPHRAPVGRLLDEFYLNPFGVRGVAVAVVALALIGALRARRPALESLAIFGPFAAFAVFMLDHHSANRFSIGYTPLFALLAAEGARVVGAASSRAAGALQGRAFPAAGRGVQLLLAGGSALILAVWGWPAIRTAATTAAPTHAAMRWIVANVDPAAARMWVHGSMLPFARYYLTGYQYEIFDGDPPLSGIDDVRGHWIVSEGSPIGESALLFRRDHGRLWKIVRRRYFETHVRPATSHVVFEEGWHAPESDAQRAWRWMGLESRAILPGLTGEAELGLEFYVPLDALPEPPEVTVVLNGAVVDRFRARQATMTRSWRVPAREGANELRITLDRAVNPARAGLSGDARDLGIRLDAIRWKAVEP